MMKSDRHKIRSTVVLYENQRFWVGGGFGKRGLLPTERGPYSTEDGSVSFKTLEEASESDILLGLGWTYEGDGFVLEGQEERPTSGGAKEGEPVGTEAADGADRTPSAPSAAAEANPDAAVDVYGEAARDGGPESPNNAAALSKQPSSSSSDDDGGGWLYSVDFSPSSLASASPSRKAQHFVRRRKLIRTRTFDPMILLLPHGGADHVKTCDHCDSDAVSWLSSKLLEALAVATLMGQNFRKQSSRNLGQPDPMRDKAVLELKRKLIKSLGLGSPPPEFVVIVNMSGDSKARLSALVAELDKFGREKGNNFLSRASHVFNQTFDDDVVRCLDERKVEVETQYFSREERDAIASLVVKHLDPEYALHCDRENCGERCEYCPLPCPNDGCGESISMKHRDEHDAVCGFKVVECPRRCGDEVPRNRMEVHMKDACPLRDAKCPLHTLGCTIVVLAKDVPQHLTDNSNAHILLAADRIMEHQTVIKRMHARIENLQLENYELKEKLAEYKGKADKDVQGVDKKVSKVSRQLGALESKCRSQFRSHVK